jgi:transposase
MNVTTYGLDVAKRVFQVHWVEPETGEVKRKRLARTEVSAFFARREPGVVAMEACGSAHHWGRLLKSLGQEVKLIAAQFVRPFVKTNKTDAADAEAIWEACQRPRMRFVAVKSAEQQAVLSLHRIRQQLVKIRTMQALQVRGLLYEFGVVVPQGWRALLVQAGPILADETRCPVPELVRRELLRQLDGLRALTTRIAELERQIGSWQRRESECQRIAAIPGVGRLTASAVVATVADARTFRSGREFAAFLGLVPRQSGTGGRVKLLGISKRGDPYLRTLLIHGARAVLRQQSRADRTLDPWLKGLLARRPKNVAIVALANKMARTIWALLAHGRAFDRSWNRAAMPIPALH